MSRTPNYKVTLLNSGKKYTGEGSTVAKALDSIKLPNIKTRCILSVAKGKTTKERILMAPTAHRAFSSAGLMREVGQRNLVTMFEGL